MPDREKVIKGLELCTNIQGCFEKINPKCPYALRDGTCRYQDLLYDALALLREQEPAKPKKALWIRPTYQDCHCSRCEMQPEHEPGSDVPLYPYCPYCGVEMEEKWE